MLTITVSFTCKNEKEAGKELRKIAKKITQGYQVGKSFEVDYQIDKKI